MDPSPHASHVTPLRAPSDTEGGGADLTPLQKAFFLGGFLLPIPSIFLYLLLPAETVQFFGGRPSPDADFWCSLNASGDAAVSAICYGVLAHPRNLALRRSALLAFAIYGILHFGSFAKLAITERPLPGTACSYLAAATVSCAAYVAWGR